MPILEKCQASPLSPTAIMERKRLLDTIIGFCRRFKVCPTCATSACLYAACLAANKGLDMPLERFLDAAKEVWADVEGQTAQRIIT